MATICGRGQPETTVMVVVVVAAAGQQNESQLHHIQCFNSIFNTKAPFFCGRKSFLNVECCHCQRFASPNVFLVAKCVGMARFFHYAIDTHKESE